MSCSAGGRSRRDGHDGLVGLVNAAVGALLGTLLGMLAAARGGFTDDVIMMLVSIVAWPWLECAALKAIRRLLSRILQSRPGPFCQDMVGDHCQSAPVTRICTLGSGVKVFCTRNAKATIPRPMISVIQPPSIINSAETISARRMNHAERVLTNQP